MHHGLGAGSYGLGLGFRALGLEFKRLRVLDLGLSAWLTTTRSQVSYNEISSRRGINARVI